jgi:hypothetical protein
VSEYLFDPAPYTRREDRGHPCSDCGMATTPKPPKDGTWEWYVVHDPVWQTARADARDLLCIGCLERRLDRQLVPQDFPDLQVNELHVIDSPRLRARKEKRNRDRV